VKVVVCGSPVSEQLVEVPQVFTKALQVVPPSVDLSILYPVIAEPPLSVGAVQVRPICEEETAVATRPVGGDGATAKVVADAVSEGKLVPIAVTVCTL